ncbi:hypothetical protein N0V88_007959 [Collariella sp. IMI 366227]|nr:hypothetical protein N0V88_007959 [Collariella sp. IMI 366227]
MTAPFPGHSGGDDGPWDEIERNYFASMRAYRDKEDASLAEDLRIRSEDHRRYLLGNYQAQTELLRQLRALRDQYDAREAVLRAMEAEYEATMEGKRREREQEDDERREWFGTYRRAGRRMRRRRGGVCGGDGEERDKRADETQGDEGMEEREERARVGVEELEEGEQVSGAEVLPNGEHLEEPGPSVAEEEMSDAEEFASGEDSEDDQDEELEPSMSEDDSLDAETPTNGAEDGRPEQEPPAEEETEPDTPASKEPFVGPEQEPTVREAGRGAMAALELLNGHREPVPAMDHDADMMDVEPSTSDNDTDGIEVPGDPVEASMAEPRAMAELKPTIGPEPKVESPSPDREVHLTTPSAPDNTSGGEDSMTALNAVQKVDRAAITQESIPIPQAEVPNVPAAKLGPVEEDIEMPDIQPSKDAEDVAMAATAESTMPLVPACPSSSSELSSRNTTPALDTPIALPNEPKTPALSPEEPDLAGPEVVDELGEILGRLQPLDAPNILIDSLKDRPLKRRVQLRPGGSFTADDLKCTLRPKHSEARAVKYLSFYIQATGEIQGRPCMECTLKNGPFYECVVVDGSDFPRCGNCEWLKRRCQGASLQQQASQHGIPAHSPPRPAIRSPRKTVTPSGDFKVVDSSGSPTMEPLAGSPTPSRVTGEGAEESSRAAAKKGARKSLPTTRMPLPPPATPANVSFRSDASMLPEISKQVLCLRDNGEVYTDPPIMRGVPLAKISPGDEYWEKELWAPIEGLVMPQLRKHQEKYDQLEQAKSTSRDKHLANRDAKRGRTILKFLEEGDLHPYQLVAKEWITPRLTHYDTLFRLAQLLLDELPKMNLDVKPSDWLRHRIHEVYEEKGDKFNLPVWLEKAYHDAKIEQLREINGFSRVGRPPAHASSKNGETGGGSSRKATAPRSLKRKETHATPESTPSRSSLRASGSPAKAAPTVTVAAAATVVAHPRPKKIKIITSRASSSADSTPTTTIAKRTRIVVHSPLPPSAVEPKQDDLMVELLEYDGYTSADSLSRDALTDEDWHLHQVKTRTIASNVRVTQYWHWVDRLAGE